MASETHFQRLETLARGALAPPPGAGRIALALTFGVAVHLVFAVAVGAMILAMYFGMSRSLGSVPWPHAIVTNAVLILQFPLVHSLLLTGPGGRVLLSLLPGPHGRTISTTTYALVASLQLLVLFALWTPSGIISWRAEGAALYMVTAVYATAWGLLIKASWDAGAEVQ
ncbi:MAG: isoprenylcysteine carboxylmethyltransferase family protein, partial [Shimia sp.]